jgi:hypothetical protein
MPEGREDLALLTQQYLVSRYGGKRPGEDQVEITKQRWQRIKRSQLKSGRSNG